MSNSKKADLYQIKVTLKYSKPPIWRRLQVSGDLNLAQLHEVLQRAMGWEDSHLHQFVVGEKYYGTPHPDWDFEVVEETMVSLKKIAPTEKSKFSYEYDFGDNWEHLILVEKILASSELNQAICIGGRRACPPEDCGGIWGYEAILEAVANSEHPEHKEAKAWLGEEFDPAEFDVKAVNQSLKEI